MSRKEIEFNIVREIGKRDQLMEKGTPASLMLALEHQNKIDDLLEEKEKLLTQLEYVDVYCDLVSIHCNDLMKEGNEDVEPIEKLALALSLLNSAVRSLKNAYEEGEHE